MTTTIIRPATLADAPAISTVHCSTVVQWRRFPEAGEAEFARYEDLSAYQRWLNGGPWMDESSCALHLARLIELEAGLALVAEVEGEVLAEAEAFVGHEPQPFGRNLNLSVLYVRRGHEGRGLGSAMMAALERRASEAGCETFMVTHAEAGPFYARRGLTHQATWHRARLPVKPGHTQYVAGSLPDQEYGSISGWAMPLGRYQSARQQWESRRPGAEPDFDEWRDLRVERRLLTVRRQTCAVILDESPRERGWADAHLWTPGAVNRQVIAAIRDLGARAGFQGLLCFVAESTLPLLGPEAQADGYKQQVWMKRLG
jgi:predicted N-acetyltransferase YhbS